jgi:hypothetical protein
MQSQNIALSQMPAHGSGADSSGSKKAAHRFPMKLDEGEGGCFANVPAMYYGFDFYMDAVPERLNVSPWTEQDDVLFEYKIDYDIMWHRTLYLRKRTEVATCTAGICSTCGISLFCMLGCLPCHLITLEGNNERLKHNTREAMRSVRVALSRDGVCIKTLPQSMMGPNPADPCGECFAKFDLHEHLKIPATTKIIPYEKIQDVRVVDAHGADNIVYFCCASSEQVPRVTTRVEVDTSGAGLEWFTEGIVEAHHFKDTIMAMKYGKPLPSACDGVIQLTNRLPSTSSRKVNRQARAQQLGAAPEQHSGMSRSGISSVSSGNDDEILKVLRSIDARIYEQTEVLKQNQQLLQEMNKNNR